MRRHTPWLLVSLCLSTMLTSPLVAQTAGSAAAVETPSVTEAGGSGLVAREYDLTRRVPATPSDPAAYLLRPGDQVAVTVLTGEDENIELTVQLAQDGSIALPWVDALDVEGLTIAQASTLIQQAYSRIYLRAFAQVQLTRLGTYQVQLQGFHQFPGMYRVYNGTSLYGLLLALNIDTDGERRLIHLYRAQADSQGNLLELAPPLEELGSYDSFDFSIRGEIDKDLFLQAYDRIVIEEPEVVIQIDRGVTRPGKYAVRPGEGLQEILQLAGQLDRNADLQNTQLTRVGPDGQLELSYIDLDEILQSGTPFELRNRDRIRINNYKNQVYVMGEVALPGAYDILPGEGVMELLAKAGGITSDAHARSISMVRPPRLYAELTAPHTVEIIDIRTFIKPGKQSELPARLQAGDILYVPSKGEHITGANLLAAASAAVSRLF